jgi:predicted deacetylase
MPPADHPLPATGYWPLSPVACRLPAVVVSVHDIASPLTSEVCHLLAALDAIGARPRVLKVVPNADGARDLRDDPALVRVLAAEVAAGSEVVLHGYTHRVAGPLRGPWSTCLRARLFAGMAAEFLTLDATQMMERLSTGRQILQSVGVEPRGFCAPGWLAPPELPHLLRQCGFHYYVSMATLWDLGTGSSLRTPWLGYMGAGALQERLVGLGGRALLAMATSVPVVKVFFHPQRAPDAQACQRILQVLARLLRERRPVTYGTLLAHAA